MSQGTLMGVGVGPGDPDLVTLKAARALRESHVIAYFAKRGSKGNGRSVVESLLADSTAEMLPLIYPYTVELSPRDPRYVEALREFYDESARRIAAHLDEGRTVSVICEGDPMFYGSYMYIHDRLADRYPTRVIPGVTSFSGCAASAGTPLVSTDRTLTVLPATLPEEILEEKLRQADAAIIMKLGRNLPKVRRVLERTGQIGRATYVERGTTSQESITPLNVKQDDTTVYFSLIMIPDHDGGPYRPLESGAASDR